MGRSVVDSYFHSGSQTENKMKIVLVLAVVCALAAVSYSKYCGGAMNNDPSVCTHSCPSGEVKTCEHGGICTCAAGCMSKEDCISANVTCGTMRNPMTGQTIMEETHCFDAICICMMPQGGQHGGQQHGGQHGGQQHGGIGGHAPGGA